MNNIRIQVCANGYILFEDKFAACTSAGGERVFESFESMTKWLRANLQQPSEEKKTK